MAGLSSNSALSEGRIKHDGDPLICPASPHTRTCPSLLSKSDQQDSHPSARTHSPSRSYEGGLLYAMNAGLAIVLSIRCLGHRRGTSPLSGSIPSSSSLAHFLRRSCRHVPTSATLTSQVDS